MTPCIVRNLRIGEGRPKICVPLVGAAVPQLRDQAEEAKKAAPDLIEWRADFFESVRSPDSLRTACAALRAVLQDTPLLFTFRTQKEGGAGDLSQTEYLDLLRFAARALPVDLIDIELLAGGDAISDMIALCHERGVSVVVSNHEFTKTPSSETMFARLAQMASLGCDIVKLAVMPESPSDVLRLLSVTERFHREASCPVVTMSMGALGRISRLCGALTGSAITFGTASAASAPGQIPVGQLREFLTALE